MNKFFAQKCSNSLLIFIDLFPELIIFVCMCKAYLAYSKGTGIILGMGSANDSLLSLAEAIPRMIHELKW